MKTSRSQDQGFTPTHSRNYLTIWMWFKRKSSSLALTSNLEPWQVTKLEMIGLQTKYGSWTWPRMKAKESIKSDQCIKLLPKSIIHTIHRLHLSRITWSTSIWIQTSLLFLLLARIPVFFKFISSMVSAGKSFINFKSQESAKVNQLTCSFQKITSFWHLRGHQLLQDLFPCKSCQLRSSTTIKRKPIPSSF